MTGIRPIPVFIDCDTGIDDALALAYLLTDPRVDVVGIGAVSGNVSAEQAAVNSLALLEAAGRTDIPVAVGSVHPRTGAFAGGAPCVHGENGIGGVALDRARREVEPITAVDLLEKLADRHPDLQVLALGPLSNLAEVVESRPQIVDAIAHVVIMGGAFDRAGNVTAAAEANIHNDPESAALVFAAAWPLTVVPLDVTMNHALTAADAAELGRMAGTVPRVLSGMLENYLDFYEGVYGARQCALHDPLAALILAGSAPVTVVQEREIDVVCAGADRGRTIYLDSVRGRSRRIVLEVGGDGGTLLMDALRRHEWVTEPG